MSDPKSWTYAPMEPIKWESIVCGGDVRWAENGKLQQRFVITEYAGGSPSGTRQEWRDVPIADDLQ